MCVQRGTMTRTRSRGGASEMAGKTQKNFLKSFLLYVFLLFLAYVVSDLALLQFVKPKFLVKLSAKDKTAAVSSFEPETRAFEISDLGTKASFTNKIVKRNIFNSKKMPAPIAKLKGEEKTEDFKDQDPVLSGLQLSLEGTIVHRNPFRSLATITGAGTTLSYTVGDSIPGMAEIISVIRKKVIIRNLKNKRLEYIEISREQAPVKKQVATNRFRNKPRSKPSKSLIKQDGNRFTAKRSDVNAQLANISKLSRQANSRLAKDPATGEVLGYEIYGIKPGLLQQMGVLNNDIISNVNGKEIKNPQAAMSLMSKLKTASEINVTVIRDGREVELEYIIE